MSTPFPSRDSAQALRPGRLLPGLAGAAAFTVLIAFAWRAGLVHLGAGGLEGFLAVFWLGNLGCLALDVGARGARVVEPGLTVLQAAWVTVNAMWLAWHLDALQSVALLFCLMALGIAAHRLDRVRLFALAGFATASYAVVVLLFGIAHPHAAELRVELFTLAGFSIAVYGLVLAGLEVSALRTKLRDRNIQLERSLESASALAVTDELTGVYNRRHLIEVLEMQKSLADRGDYEFSVCFADLDHFKRVNDRFGHAVGDRVLTRFVDACRAQLRDHDYLARFGGEEFVLVLARTPLAGARETAERLRRRVERADFSDIAPGLSLTLSAGVTAYHAGEAVEQTLFRADAAMYRAKQRGRNQVTSD